MRRRFVFDYGETLTAMIRNPRTLGRLGRLRSTLFMRWQLRDPEVRRKVWPDYTFGCKRVLFSSYFLPALQRADVELVTEPITEITAGRAPDRRRPPSTRSTASSGGPASAPTTSCSRWRSAAPAAGRLADEWEGGAHAHLGITVPGFPSLFLMYGPNTNTSGGSIVFYLEAQAAYIRQALQRVRDAGAAAIAVRPDVEAASDRATQERFAGTAWLECDSWYRDETGRIVTNWPGYMREYAERTAELDPDEYELVA